MSTLHPTDTQTRTRLASPGWRLNADGSFALDLSWDATSYRWLEVQPDPDTKHCWRLVLREAADDSSDASHEVLLHGVYDVTQLLIDTELSPWPYDRAPHPEQETP